MAISKKKENVNKNVFSFKLENIKIFKMEFNSLSDPPEEESLFNFTLNIESKIDNEKEKCLLQNSVQVLNSDKSIVYGSISVGYIFDISNIKKNQGQKKFESEGLPEETLNRINDVVISTTRGIMYNSFKGTFLDAAILPIIDSIQLKKS